MKRILLYFYYETVWQSTKRHVESGDQNKSFTVFTIGNRLNYKCLRPFFYQKITLFLFSKVSVPAIIPPLGCHATGDSIFYLPFSATDWTSPLASGSLLAGLINGFIILSLVTHFLPFLVRTLSTKNFPSGRQENLGSVGNVS